MLWMLKWTPHILLVSAIIGPWIMGEHQWLSFIALAILVLLIVKKTKRFVRCKECKKWLTMQNIGTELTGSNDIYVRVENETRSERTGEVTSRTEQHIPGTRKSYETTYRCKNCGAERYWTTMKDSANI